MKCILVLLSLLNGNPVYVNSCQIVQMLPTECARGSGTVPCVRIFTLGNPIEVTGTGEAVAKALNTK